MSADFSVYQNKELVDPLALYRSVLQALLFNHLKSQLKNHKPCKQHQKIPHCLSSNALNFCLPIAKTFTTNPGTE